MPLPSTQATITYSDKDLQVAGEYSESIDVPLELREHDDHFDVALLAHRHFIPIEGVGIQSDSSEMHREHRANVAEKQHNGCAHKPYHH